VACETAFTAEVLAKLKFRKNSIAVFQKIGSLIKEIARTPFVGRGKPEPLRGNLSGFWSRRITGKHRLVYKVEQEFVVIASCKSHYGDR